MYIVRVIQYSVAFEQQRYCSKSQILFVRLETVSGQRVWNGKHSLNKILISLRDAKLNIKLDYYYACIYIISLYTIVHTRV